MKSNAQYDLIIVGAGPVGMLTAIALADRNTSICLVDPTDNELTPKSHPMTIRQSTQTFLCAMQVWPDLQNRSHPLGQINLVHNEHFGSIHFKQTQLGYIIDAAHLVKALQKSVSQNPCIKWIRGASLRNLVEDQGSWSCKIEISEKTSKTITAKRVIACDGVLSNICESLKTPYKKVDKTFYSAIVEVQTSNWQAGYAWQVVMGEAIAGLIPSQKANSGHVIITSEKPLNNLDRWVEEACQGRLGTIQTWRESGIMHSCLKMRDPMQQPGVIALGNARLALPPIAAQGFNFAVDDIRTLAHWQKRGTWQSMDAKIWQQGWYQHRQPYAEQLYQDMQRIWTHMTLKPSTLRDLIHSAAWSWMGCDARLQASIQQKGQGMRAIHE
ncbi:MAG: FAD-dependent monooxygenase [Pseudomonadota bacterium]|nr:FAD-dependent monooxygenase [Pseudomonadota bacterium]